MKSFQKNKKSFCKFLRFLVKYIPCLNQPKPRTTAYRVFSYASVNTHQVCGNTRESCGNTHRACGNTHRACGNTRESWGNTHRAWGNTRESCGNTRESCGNVGRTEALPRRCRGVAEAKWRGGCFGVIPVRLCIFCNTRARDKFAPVGVGNYMHHMRCSEADRDQFYDIPRKTRHNMA